MPFGDPLPVLYISTLLMNLPKNLPKNLSLNRSLKVTETGIDSHSISI